MDCKLVVHSLPLSRRICLSNLSSLSPNRNVRFKVLFVLNLMAHAYVNCEASSLKRPRIGLSITSSVLLNRSIADLVLANAHKIRT